MRMTFKQLNRKTHIYTGLFLIFFIFLFAISGFMLNHRWSLWDYWKSRNEQVKIILVDIPDEDTDLAKARNILSQTGCTGEIHFISHNVQSNLLEIKTTRPGQKTAIEVDLATGAGQITVTDLNGWELLPALHVLTGLHSNISNKKNWFWTKIWSLMIDITAVGLLVLLASGFYLWLSLGRERRIGLMIMETGFVIFILLLWILSKFPWL
jgi:hypothetical protein